MLSRDKHLAAIDVGSNAIRFVVSEVSPSGQVQTLEKLREPVRLGSDVFNSGMISPESYQKALTAFKKFRKKMRNYGVNGFKAVATSAVREAKNGQEFVEQIFGETGIDLEVIDYKKEALFIHRAVSSRLENKDQKVVIMDIGGGSVEYIYSCRGVILEVESYPYGTVRSLKKMKTKKSTKDFLSKAQVQLEKLAAKVDGSPNVFVGTGGNLICLGGLRMALLGKKSNCKLRLSELNRIIKILEDLGYEGRMSQLKLRRDRADVILPAAYMTKLSMQVFKVDQMRIPHVGLRDGLILCQNSL